MYKIIVYTQAGSEAKKEGIDKLLWAYGLTKKQALEVLERLKRTGVNGYILEEKAR